MKHKAVNKTKRKHDEKELLNEFSSIREYMAEKKHVKSKSKRLFKQLQIETINELFAKE